MCRASAGPVLLETKLLLGVSLSTPTPRLSRLLCRPVSYLFRQHSTHLLICLTALARLRCQSSLCLLSFAVWTSGCCVARGQTTRYARDEGATNTNKQQPSSITETHTAGAVAQHQHSPHHHKTHTSTALLPQRYRHQRCTHSPHTNTNACIHRIATSIKN